MERIPACRAARSIVGLLLLAGCGEGGSDTPVAHTFQIVTEEGVPVAVNRGGPKYEGEIFRYKHLVSLREGEPESSLLGQPGPMDTDGQGLYFVVDHGNRRIAVFDEQGRYSHDIGRSGSGPGEFLRSQILDVRDGRIFVWDSNQQRTSVFRTDGTFERLVTVPRDIGFRPSEMHLLPGDNLLALGSEYRRESESSVRRVAILMDAGGDSLWSFDTASMVTGRMIDRQTSSGLTVRAGEQYRYAPRPVLHYQPGRGILAYREAGGDLEIAEPGADPTLRIRLDMPLRPVGEHDRQAYRSYYTRIAEREEEQAAFIREQLEIMLFAEEMLPWAGAALDDAGFVWLAVNRPPSLSAGQLPILEYFVVSPDGEYLGRTTLPLGVSYIKRGLALVNASDFEKGTIALEVYRITPAVEGLSYP